MKVNLRNYDLKMLTNQYESTFSLTNTEKLDDELLNDCDEHKIY